MKAAKKKLKRARRYLVYLLVRALTAPISLLPLPWALALGRALGRLAALLAVGPRRRAEAQLVEALQLGPREASRTARACFAHMGMVAVELLLLPRLLPRLEALVELPEDARAIFAEVRAEGRGGLLVTGHVGSWELLAQRLIREAPGATLARRSPNPFLGDWLVRRRRLGGLETINRGDPQAARRMLGVLKRGELLGVLLDQDTKVDSIHAPFFGRPAATPVAAAELALRRKLPIVTAFIHRRPGGRHAITVERLRFEPDPTADHQANVRSLTSALNAEIERAIRAAPSEWVWFHARWKTPEAAAPASEGRRS